MTASESRLVRILAAVSAIAVIFVAVAVCIERVGESRARIAEYRGKIGRLEGVTMDEAALRARLAAVQAEIDGAERRESAAMGSSMYEFGKKVKLKLSACGISPQKYQAVSTAKGEELELSLRCGVGNFLSFLRSATGRRGGWRVPYLSLHMTADGALAEIVVRLSE